MSYSDDLEDVVREIRQRVTRIESRICRIGDGLEISLRNPKKGLKVLSVSEDAVALSTECLDIALSELISFSERNGFADREVDIFHGDVLISTLFLKEKGISD